MKTKQDLEFENNFLRDEIERLNDKLDNQQKRPLIKLNKEYVFVIVVLLEICFKLFVVYKLSLLL